MKADLLYCSIRQQMVAALPEERVRQHLIQHLINDLGFPAGGIAVEMPLDQMPHLQEKGLVIPDRRADIICFTKQNELLMQLLMVECKAVPLSAKVLQQVTGYNHYVQARYLAIANGEELRMGWKVGSDYRFVDFIPHYTDLLNN